MYLLLFIALILLVTYLLQSLRRPSNYPPGPSWLPMVGNFPQLKKLSRKLGGQHLALIELAKQYKTNILGLKLGKTLVVTVFSYPIVRTVLTGEEYEGRPDNFFIRLRSMGTRKGITCTDGDHWLIQRNFAVRHLRSLGFGKKQMEVMIKEELSEVLLMLDNGKTEGQIGRLLAPSVINIIWSLVAGSCISRKDTRLEKLLDLLTLRGKVFDMSGGILSQHPWLRFLAPEKTGYNVIQRLNNELKHFFMEAINEHYANWSEGNEDDLIYSFITEMKKNDGCNSTFSADQLVMVCLDLFIAGSQTTSNTLDFAFLMMILNPDVQTKVQAHLDTNLGKEQLEYSDRHNLPYVEAVLLEVERFCHVTPVCGPRRVLKDTVLNGYSIPKDTTVLISLYSVHNDMSIWGDPENFRPERFLDEQGKVFINEKLIPFGLGRRRCLGEALAKCCIFMFFVGILREYTVIVKPKSAKPTGIPLPGITLSPENYAASFVKRKTHCNNKNVMN